MKSLHRCLPVAALGVVCALGLLASSAMGAAPPQAASSSPNYRQFDSPPPDFNPLAATAAQLETYGLPLPPPRKDDPGYQWWVEAVTHSRHRVGNPAPGPLAPPLGSWTSQDKPTWSGYVAQGETYYDVQDNFSVVALNPDSVTGSRAAHWVGLGGWGVTSLAQVGVVESAGSPPVYQAVWEDTSQNPNNATPLYTVYVGDAINELVSVDYPGCTTGQFYYYIVDTTHYEYEPFCNTPTAMNLDTADWVTEDPPGDPLADFGT